MTLCDFCSSFGGGTTAFSHSFNDGEKVRVMLDLPAEVCCPSCGREKFVRHAESVKKMIAFGAPGTVSINWQSYADVIGSHPKNQDQFELEINEILIYLGKLTLEGRGTWRFSDSQFNPTAFNYLRQVYFVEEKDVREYARVLRRGFDEIIRVDSIIARKDVFR